MGYFIVRIGHVYHNISFENKIIHSCPLQGKSIVPIEVAKARPISEVAANKAARGEKNNLSPAELAALEESGGEETLTCRHA